jgi:amidohydrolase
MVTTHHQLTEWAITHRRYLHQHPELSGQEFETCRYIRNELTKVGIEILDYKAPSTVGFVPGTVGEKTILLRADIDALPIGEEGEDKPYISKVPGVAHACGHDGHTAILLAVARWIMENRELIKNNIMLVFQSSEELAPSGAEKLVKEGILEEVDVAFGLHLMSSLPKGQIGVCAGPMMASSDDFEITLNGKGGHGASPQETIDPTIVAAHLILGIQSIIARQINPIDAGVISIGKLNGGSNYNIIPNEVEITGTFRAFTMETRNFIMEKLVHLTHSISATFGATAKINIIPGGTPPVVNNVAVTNQVAQILKDNITNREIIPFEKVMLAEDFAFYLQQKQGSYFVVGMGGEKSAYPHHHPKFDIDEEEIGTAIEAFQALAKHYVF